MRIEGLEFPYEGNALIRVATRKYVQERLESQYTLELTNTGGAAPSTAAPATSAQAPVQPDRPAGSGISMLWIGLGVVAVALLLGGAYRLGRRTAPPR